MHVPHARSTFGTDITEHFTRHYPATFDAWLRLQAFEDAPVTVTQLPPNAVAKWVFHAWLFRHAEDVPSLDRLREVVDALVAVCEQIEVSTLAIYGLEPYGLHGPVFAAYLRTAFARRPGTTLYLYDRQPLRLET